MPARCPLAVLWALPVLTTSHPAVPTGGASLQLFTQPCASKDQNSTQVVLLNLANTVTLSDQCSALVSLCLQSKTDAECRLAAADAAPKLRDAISEMTGALVSLSPSMPEDLRNTITSTLVSFTSSIGDLVPQIETVENCAELETAIFALCAELLLLAPRIMRLAIPVIVLAVLGVGFCVFYWLSCACLVFCNCGIFACCLGRRRGAKRRRVSFKSEVSCEGRSPGSRTAPLGHPVRKKAIMTKDGRYSNVILY